MSPFLTSTKVMERPKCGEGICSGSKTYKLVCEARWRKCHDLAASGVGSLIFIDDITHEGGSRINSEVYKNILSANLQKNVSY